MQKAKQPLTKERNNTVMIKKIAAVFTAVVMALALAGCSGKYVMTEEDLALYKQLQGYWMADDSTGYVKYNDNGTVIGVYVVEFSDEFTYVLHYLDLENQAVLSQEPIKYEIEELKFKTYVQDVAYYAAMSISEDGQTLNWITDGKSEKYLRITEERARELGIPEYDPDSWTTTESESVSEGGSETVSETEAVSETAGETTGE